VKTDTRPARLGELADCYVIACRFGVPVAELAANERASTNPSRRPTRILR